MNLNFKKLQWTFNGPSTGRACIAALLLYPVIAFLLFENWMLSAVLSGVLGAGANFLYNRYVTALQARCEAAGGIPWDVEVNGVKVGVISDAEYAAIRLRVFKDVRNYLKQWLNMGEIIVRACSFVLRATPLYVFWGLVILAVFFPDDFSSLIQELRIAFDGLSARNFDSAALALQHSGPAAITSAVKYSVHILGFAFSLGLATQLLFRMSQFGYVNHFADATNIAIRKHCKVSAEGTISLIRWVKGSLQINDELRYIRRADARD